MKPIPNQFLMAVAAGVLLLGAAWAGNLYFNAPAPKGPDPQQIRELAQRIEAQPMEEQTLVAPAPGAAASTANPQAAPAKPSTTAASPAKPAAPATPATSTPALPAVREDPVKNIALMGVTRQGESDEAWLVDTSSQQRETAQAGGTAFGF